MMKARMARNVPVIMQMETTECGAAALAMILAYYGRWITLETARQDCGVSRDGSKAINVLKAARKYGMEADPYRYTIEELRDEAKLPCIIYWNFNHFVVFCGFKGKRALINDPARGAVEVDLEEFDRSFAGIALCVEPGEAFEKGGAPSSIFQFAKERLRGMTVPIVLVAPCCMIIAIATFVYSSVSRVYLDHVLMGESPEWLAPVVVIMAFMVLTQLVMMLARSFVIDRVNSKFAVVGSSRGTRGTEEFVPLTGGTS